MALHQLRSPPKRNWVVGSRHDESRSVPTCHPERLGVGCRYTSGTMTRMCDKYMLYVYSCISSRRRRLTDKEQIRLFGPQCNNTLTVELDPAWFSEFLIRVRSAHRDLAECASKNMILPPPKRAFVRTRAQGEYVTMNEKEQVIQIQYTQEPKPNRSTGRSAHITLSDVAFTQEDFSLSLVLTQTNKREPHLALADLLSAWSLKYTVKERDIRGVRVESDCIYTVDGAALYKLISAWKVNCILSFHENCRTDIVQTLCSLALGDPNLGKLYKLKCILPESL